MHISKDRQCTKNVPPRATIYTKMYMYKDANEYLAFVRVYVMLFNTLLVTFERFVANNPEIEKDEKAKVE